MRHRFLVIRWSGMGDIVMTLPAIQWLKDHFKNCHISYLTDTAFAGIVAQSGVVDHVARFDRRGFATAGRFLPALSSAIAGIFRFRSRGIDMAFDLQGFGETAVLAYLSGAPVRVGRIKKSPLRKRIYNMAITGDWEQEHRTRFFVRAVAEASGLQVPDSIEAPRLQIAPAAAAKTRKWVGLNIGASTESRRWSETRFYDLAKRLAADGHAVRFFVGPQEKFLHAKTHAICRKNGWELASHQGMQPLMAALAQCRLIVSNDTGPGHLAAALGVPVVTLFSTGDPANVRPPGTTGPLVQKHRGY